MAIGEAPINQVSPERADTEADTADTKKYVFRGDDKYRGGAVGKALGADADSAKIQSFDYHVLRKESNVTSRFTSFTTELKIARKFTGAVDDRRVAKADMSKLQEIESRGIIRIWDPDQVFEVLMDGPRKLARQAGDVRSAMRRNCEILIEGQVPARIVLLVN
jgi:hypothetical protein